MTDETLLATSCYLDADSDGYGAGPVLTTLCADTSRAAFMGCPSGYSHQGGLPATRDCNDGNGAIRPLGTELCNGIDDDCDGMTDEGVTTPYYRDADGDGFGAGMPLSSCVPPSGYVGNATDCDDTRASVSPSGAEICDATLRDDDCDGTANEGCACTDGAVRACGGGTPVRGACRSGTQNCIAGAWAPCSGNIDPGTLTETCNGLDDDCDGMTDETLLATACYLDADSDGYGNGPVSTTLCRDAMRAGGCPSGYSNVTGDCGDSNAAIRPGGTESCDGGAVDEDCDGSIDEGCACTNGAVRVCGGGEPGGRYLSQWDAALSRGRLARVRRKRRARLGRDVQRTRRRLRRQHRRGRDGDRLHGRGRRQLRCRRRVQRLRRSERTRDAGRRLQRRECRRAPGWDGDLQRRR
jgi:hypothetical protein